MQVDRDRRWAPTAASMFGDLAMADDEPPNAPPWERIIIDLVIDRDSEAECDETVLYRALERERLAGQAVPRSRVRRPRRPAHGG